MTDEQIKEGLKNLTEEQKEIINEYCVDEMKELKKISHFAWERFGLPFSVRDDLYSDALKVLMESILTYDGSRGANFKTFLSNNIKLSASEWYRDNYLRSKRNNLKLDVNGNIERDENGNPIIVQNLSFDAPTVLNDDEMDLKEKIPAPEVSKENVSINLQNYLDTLSEMESTIALYILDGYKLKEIKDILHISDKQLERYKRNMSTFERYRLLKHDDYVGKEMEDKEMSVGYTTLEKSKPDRQSIASIISEVIYDGIGCDAANSEIENLDIVNEGKEEDTESLEDEVNSESVMDVNVKANGEDINAGDTVSTIDFVKENVTENVNEEDIEFYKDMVDDCVKVDSPVYVSCKTALIALMAYACQNETDEKFEKWIEQYKYQTNFSRSQKVNYMYMKNNFDKMCREEG